MFLSGDEVKKHWKSLRDKYKRARDKYDMQDKDGASSSTYFMKDQLSFLNEHLVDRKK